MIKANIQSTGIVVHHIIAITTGLGRLATFALIGSPSKLPHNTVASRSSPLTKRPTCPPPYIMKRQRKKEHVYHIFKHLFITQIDGFRDM